MNVAQVGGGGGFDPSVLPGLGSPEYMDWTWQSPKQLGPQTMNGKWKLLSLVIC